MTIHKLKTWMPYFDDIKAGIKTFEIRKNDRNFQIGDKLLLQEYDQEKKVYTGREVCVEVLYILPGGSFGIDSEYCILGITQYMSSNKIKTIQDIQTAIKQCSIAQRNWDVKKCPIWSNDEELYCHDCTCRSALRWTLGVKDE